MRLLRLNIADRSAAKTNLAASNALPAAKINLAAGYAVLAATSGVLPSLSTASSGADQQEVEPVFSRLSGKVES